MPLAFNAILITLLAYTLGSLPFGVIAGRLAAGRDVRAGGSGHTGATNVFRQAGWPAAAAVAVLDIGKGFAAAWLDRQPPAG